MSDFFIDYSDLADEQLHSLINDPSKRTVAKAVVKSLKYMSINIRHPSLNTHKFDDMKGPKGEEVFESYAQNNTPGAYRIFWYYGPGKSIITILAITPHP
jgi:hypothetical protein